MFTSSGIIKYDPTSETGKFQEWWLVINCSDELKTYYEWFIRKEKHEKIHQSVWGQHITLIRGEKPVFEHLWRKYEGMELAFTYTGELNTNGCHWWLEVDCPEGLNIREELGLPRNPKAPLHLTLGRVVKRLV